MKLPLLPFLNNWTVRNTRSPFSSNQSNLWDGRREKGIWSTSFLKGHRAVSEGNLKSGFGFTFRESGFLSKLLPGGWISGVPHSWCINQTQFRSTSMEYMHENQGAAGLKVWYKSDLSSSSLPQVYEFSDLMLLWDDVQHSKTAEPHCVTFFPLETGSDDRLAIVFTLFAFTSVKGFQL